MFTILTNTGRGAIASAVRDLSLYMAFGIGQDHWNTTRESVATFSSSVNTFNLGYTEIDNVHVYAPSTGTPTTEFTAGVDYTINKTTGILTRVNGAGIGNTSVRVVFYVKPATPSLTATDLIGELARKQIYAKQFVTPDPEGEIILPGGTYSPSNSPTAFLHIACTLLEPELPTSIIREVGVFASPVFAATPPNGTTLFTPNMFSNKGKLMLVRNYPAITRNEAAREAFQYVIPF